MTKRKNTSIVRNIFISALKANLLANLTFVIGSFVDGVFIGNFLGIEAAAAYGMVWPVTFIYLIIILIISGGACIVYMRLVGEGNIKEANKVFTLATVTGVFASLVMIVLTYVFSDTICILIGANNNAENLKPYIIGFLRGYCLGLPFQALARIWAEYMAIDSDGNRNLYASLVLAITDIIGHILIVYMFNSSIFGFGVATSIGFIACLLAYLVHFSRKDRMLRFDFSGLLSETGYLKDIFINGTPHGTEKLASATAGILVNHMLADMVTGDYIALYSVQKQFISFWGVSYQGVASTVYSLSGVFFGEEDRKALDTLQKDTVVIGGRLVIALVAIILLFPVLFFRIFLKSNSVEVLSLGSEATRVIALTFPFYMVAFSFYKYMMGTKHIKGANVYILLLQCGITVPVTFLMLKCMGGRGIWFGNGISLIIMCVIAFFYILFYRHGKTLNEKRLLLNEDFGTDMDKELVITASNLKTVVGISRIAEKFCRENGIDEIRANRFRLCLDEIGTNIIKHGFDDGKKHMIDIRLLIKKDELIIRIRDDCKPFNPIERYNMTVMDKEDPGKNMGIRMVMKMSKDVQYHSANKTNNLIIKV